MFLFSHEAYQIDKDIPRTCVPAGLTPAQRADYLGSVKAVLNAYSNLNKEVGYVQGMNIVVSALISSTCDNYEAVKDFVPRTLILFYNLMEGQGYQIADLYCQKMTKVIKLLRELEQKIKFELPQVYDQVAKQDVGSEGVDVQLLPGVLLRLRPEPDAPRARPVDAEPGVLLWANQTGSGPCSR